MGWVCIALLIIGLTVVVVSRVTSKGKFSVKVDGLFSVDYEYSKVEEFENGEL